MCRVNRFLYSLLGLLNCTLLSNYAPSYLRSDKYGEQPLIFPIEYGQLTRCISTINLSNRLNANHMRVKCILSHWQTKAIIRYFYNSKFWQSCTKLYKVVQSCTKLYKVVQSCTKLCKVQSCAKLCKQGEKQREVSVRVYRQCPFTGTP